MNTFLPDLRFGWCFSDQPARAGSARAIITAVLSYCYWQQRFGDDRSIIGKQINLVNVPFTITGVTPPGFEGTMSVGSTYDVTIPIAWEPQIYTDGRRSQMTQGGADRRDVLMMIVWQGRTLALTGVTLGLAAAYGVTKYLENHMNLKRMLYGVRVNDPLTYSVLAGVLILVTLVACCIPARRAANVDPMVALRYE